MRTGKIILVCLPLMAAAITEAELVTDYVTATNAGATNSFMGNVGVGTNNPVVPLHVVGDSQVDGGLTVSGAMKVPKQGDVSMGSYTNGEAVDGISGGGGNCLWITNASGDVYVLQKVGIGTNAPSVQFEVKGDAKISGVLTVGGGMTAQGTVSMGTNKITDLLDPSDDQDAATKKWVSDNYLSSETDPVWSAVSNQYALTNEVVKRLVAGSNVTLSPTNGQGDVTITASGVGFTNTIGGNAYTNAGFNLQAGSNITFRNSGGTNFVDGQSGGSGTGGGVTNMFRVDKNHVNQGILDNVVTKITFTNVVSDLTSGWTSTNSRYTVTQAGKYLFVGSLGGYGGNNSSYLAPILYVNGSKQQVGSYVLAYNSLDRNSFTSFAPVDLASNDYVEIYVCGGDCYNSGGVHGNTTNTFFAAWKFN